jgi:transglutaminase-like putative cysteine protease
MKLHVHHSTRYLYGSPVRQSLNEARLQPQEDGRQKRLGFTLVISPSVPTQEQLDFYGNHVHFFEISKPHQELLVDACSIVETPDAPALGLEDRPAPLASFADCALQPDLFDFLQPSHFVDSGLEIAALAGGIIHGENDAWQAAQLLMHWVHDEFRYQPSVTNVHTTMSEALRLKQGVCQDFAHVMIGLCRSLGLPSRYVSGYLYNGPSDQLKGAQATHAWSELWVPGVGWVGLDPTNKHPTDQRYVKAAVGRDYSDVAPIKGSYRGTAERSLSVEVLVTRQN